MEDHMRLGRRTVLQAASTAIFPLAQARAQPARNKLKVGIITDLSGPYADLSRPSLACAQQAVEDFGAAAKGWDVEILLAEHQNKADIAVTVARRWFDQDGVDALLDVSTSATSLACVGIVREKNKAMMLSGPGTTAIQRQRMTVQRLSRG
jgi:branched-chain amino acid transport system substrate-binding protein